MWQADLVRRLIVGSLRNEPPEDLLSGLKPGQDYSPTDNYTGWPTFALYNTTPGKARDDMTEEQIIATKWGKDPRRVTSGMKQQAFEDYGLSGNRDETYPLDKHGRRYQIDHLIPREMGGADDQSNLWPMPYNTNKLEWWPGEDDPWNVVLKDITANKLTNEVRAGRMTLQEARDRMLRDWRMSYIEFYGFPEGFGGQ